MGLHDHRERPEERGINENIVLRPGRRTSVQPGPGGSECAIFGHLQEGAAEEPGGYLDRGGNRPHQGWDDLRCLRNQ